MADVMSDEEIICKVIAGDQNAYREIVSRYQNMVFGFGMRFFRNEDDACDFAQDILVKAFQNLSSFRGSAPFRFWLSRLAYNAAVNRYHSNALKKEDPLYSPDELRSRDSSLPAEYERNEVRDCLMSAIAELPEEYRICLDLYFFEGLSHLEISEITGFPVGTIKSNVFRAKKILRDQLKGTVAEEYEV
jgi:RNA polymerase sigma-70 factor, ECF subfamily